MARAIVRSDGLAERFEGCAHFRHEERRLFPGRKVRAFGKLVVVDRHYSFSCWNFLL
jgi:hypothetical protein